MSFIDNINNFIDLFISALRLINRLKAWLLLLLLFAVYWLLLYSHIKFYSPLVYGIISPWLNLNDQYAKGFTHYPGQFILLPYYFGWAKLAFGLFIEGAILGGVASVFYKNFHASDNLENQPVSNKFNLWIQLSLAWIFLNGSLVLVNLFIPSLFAPILYSSSRQMLFNYLIMPGIYIFLVAIFFYTIPCVAIYRVNAFRAAIDSIKYFLKNPILTFFLSLFIMIVPLIISIILNTPNVIVEKFYPELIYWIITGGLVVDIFIGFLWMGTATTYLKNQE